MKLYDDFGLNLGATESDILAAPSSSGIGVHKPPRQPGNALDLSAGPGIGLGEGSQAKNAPRDPLNEEISRMSTADKVFAAMGEFGAGLQGKSSPLRARIEDKRKQRLLDMEETRNTVATLKQGIDLLDGLSGQERAKFAKTYGERLSANDPDLGAAFMTLSEKPETGRAILKWSETSPTLKRAIEIGGIRAATKLIQSPEALKTIVAEIDTGRVPVIHRKLQTFITGWQQIVPEEMKNAFEKDGRLSASEVIRANTWIKANRPDLKDLAIDDDDFQVMSRHSKAVWGAVGILSPEDEADVIKEKAKDEGKHKGPQSELGRLKADLDAGLISKGDYDAKVRKLTHVGAEEKLTGPQKRTNEEIDAARARIADLSEDDIKRLTQKTMNTGRDNPHYDALVDRDVKLSLRKKFGDDPDHGDISSRIRGRRQAAAGEQAEYERAVETLKGHLSSPNLTSAMKKDIQSRLDKAHALARQKGLTPKK